MQIKNLLEKYPDFVPVMIESDLEISKKKYLIRKSNTLGQVIMHVRKNITGIREEEALFFLINNTMIPISSNISVIYDEHKKDDFILYINVCKENTFGN